MKISSCCTILMVTLFFALGALASTASGIGIINGTLPRGASLRVELLVFAWGIVIMALAILIYRHCKRG